ncbi:2-hydroxyacid dehydrogenase [Herbidospora sp. NBRC 101105]|uniref:2-hydroxyacid dehydrogenase n=1 Tax=Herbidospora sp. NBRC 101105 TaxID=3032195 RepID=UPI0024A05EFE|nr:2-hydroxyacid dehydrogenase [Herbidospora sp. NBRC 101105]GLX94695.1 hydroxyacid dehydrogenase [Herbidospora sp. NBRC 101105]
MTDLGRPWRLLALPPLPADAVRGLLSGLGDRIDVVTPASRDRAAVLDLLPETEIVVGDWSSQLVLDAEAVARAPKLAFVQQPAVGVDGHDLAALADAGVPLANTAGVNAIAVAEWCVASAFALVRRLVQGDAAVRAGDWPQLTLQPRELSSCKVGLVGFGPIGAACARMFGAMGCEVAYWSRSPRQETYGAAYQDLDQLVATSDIVVIVVALTDDTRGLFDAGRLATMKPGSFLVNAARGGIVDEKALIEAGNLAGVALDVFTTEPLPLDDPLRSDDRILLSPHAAGVTPQSTTRLVQCVVGNLAAAVGGAPVINVVNGVNPVVKRR